MTKVVDNFLPDAVFEKLHHVMMGNYVPWYYNPNITNEKTDDKHFYMSHKFYGNNFFSEMFKFVEPLLNAVAPKQLIRIKGNLYPNQGELVIHEPHFDYEFSHQAALFSINDNDGGTIIDGEMVQSAANRIVFFDGSELHSSTTCSNASARININMNYLEDGE